MAGKRYGQGRDQLHDGERKRAFGLEPKDKWPDEGFKSQFVRTNGFEAVVVKVLPKGAAKRRCLAYCPLGCKKWVCAGHLGQHIASHAEG
jgi:hypothetical protein